MMRFKVVAGATVAGALLGIGVLAGSVIGASGVSAQTSVTPSQANPTAQAQATPGANNGQPGGKHGEFGRGMRGGMGGGMKGGGFGFGERGWGMMGGAATADQANNVITRANTEITSVKSDLAYANGKMDTTDVQRWINGADALVKSAQNAVTAQQYSKAAGYAEAAAQLAQVADRQMADKLGADKLPSYSQRPQHAGRPDQNATNTATPTQAQASRVLASTYQQLLMQGTLVKSSANSGDAATYLTDAQNAYKTAYSAYQAGKYTDAVSSARLAGELAEVSSTLVRAANAPNDANTPVTVPAPSF